MLAGFFFLSAIVDATSIAIDNSPYEYKEIMTKRIDSLRYQNSVLQDLSDMQNKKLKQMEKNITFMLTNTSTHVTTQSGTR